MIVRFEELSIDTDKQLEKLLKFLNQKPPDSQIQCALANKMGIYKRTNKLLPFDPYAQLVNGSSLRQIVEKTRKIVYKTVDNYLNLYNLSHQSST